MPALGHVPANEGSGTMKRRLAILSATVVLWSAVSVLAAETIANTGVTEMVQAPADTVADQELETQIEAALETQLEQAQTVQPQTVEEPAAPQTIPAEFDKAVPPQEDPFEVALHAFVEEAYTGQTETITGIFVNEDFTLDVVQQPQNNPDR